MIKSADPVERDRPLPGGWQNPSFIELSLASQR